MVGAAVEGLAPLLADPSSAQGCALEVVVLDARTGGLRQGTERLAHRRGIDAPRLASLVRDGATGRAALAGTAVRSRAPVYAMSVDAMKRFEMRVAEAGCSGFVTKPIDVDEMPEKLAGVLGGGCEAASLKNREPSPLAAEESS